MLYPIGIQDFEKLREGAYVYVDKTALMYKLVSTGTCYFLSRPRRFGKSMLLSTLEAYFSGKKELFEGLAVAELEKDWIEYPVFRIDFNGSAYNEEMELDDKLNSLLSKWEKEFGLSSDAKTPGVRFSELIDAAYEKTGRQVVVLIDEYDKPIVDNITKPEVMEIFRSRLQGFYSVLKAKDRRIKFAMLTGVSKIGKLSIFSGLNNLEDVSMLPDYASICGISETELHKYFDTSVAELAESNRMSKEDCYAKLKKMYDGYHFCIFSEGMYNPFSLLNTLKSRHFSKYWFYSGTPTLLVDVMKHTSFDVTKIEKQRVKEEALNGVNSIMENPVPLFFQTGYLTIQDYNPQFSLYSLGFPNDEVRSAFLDFLLQYYIPKPGLKDSLIQDLSTSLYEGRPEEFMTSLDSLFAGTSYKIMDTAEKNFQYAMYLIAKLMGYMVEVEYTTSNGRIDLLVKTPDYIYIIELKIDSTADAALQQIEDKGYARPFASDPRRLYKIGINFRTDDRRIDDWKIE